MKKGIVVIAGFSVLLLLMVGGDGYAQDAQTIVADSFNYWRGEASIATVTMRIHRADWERSYTIKAWTKGEKESLFTILSPPKDEGNGTLKRGSEMWMYNPKIDRVIKVPPSMMSQSWMGSDFSNNDLAKSDSLLYDYTHTLTGTEVDEGTMVYLITSIPKPDAPVVWGMQKLKIREDLIFLREEFYDEDQKLVKALDFYDIQILGGRRYPRVMKMQKTEAPDEYTLVEYDDLTFEETLSDDLFTLSALKTPRR
ncbi:MAG: outer membrane lipoprotein-sorting protein [Deltaproteobacteria bacterium]|nr:outer membrane lipoprotein-sorting protein [Deltaproteobacteria bacterium]